MYVLLSRAVVQSWFVMELASFVKLYVNGSCPSGLNEQVYDLHEKSDHSGTREVNTAFHHPDQRFIVS